METSIYYVGEERELGFVSTNVLINGYNQDW